MFRKVGPFGSARGLTPLWIDCYSVAESTCDSSVDGGKGRGIQAQRANRITIQSGVEPLALHISVFSRLSSKYFTGLS